MATVRDFILEGAIKGTKYRLDKLIELNAPKVMIEGVSGLLDELVSGKIKISGDTYLLDKEFENYVIKKGNGGKEYYIINGNINYFPYARYGRYIKEATK